MKHHPGVDKILWSLAGLKVMAHQSYIITSYFITSLVTLTPLLWSFQCATTTSIYTKNIFILAFCLKVKAMVAIWRLLFYLLSHDYLMTLSRSFLWLSHDFLLTFFLISHDFFMTFSWLSHDFLMTFSRFFHDFRITSHELLN